MSSAALSLRAITRHHTDAERAAVDALSLDVHAGELLAIVGDSGAGKTTLLRMIAGYDRPDAGTIWIGRASGALDDVTRWAPERRGVGMVFQHGALFPHLTVAGNVEFGVVARGVSGDERRRRTDDALAGVGLGAYGARDVRSLSGGEQQRVALARSLAVGPRVLLLDEPFASLDPALRIETREAVARRLRAAGVTALFVTHDRDDAFAVADRVAVMHGGRLLHVDAPAALYDAPRSATVARRTGRVSFLAARRDGDGAEVAVAGVAQRLVAVRAPAAAADERCDGAWLAVLRPEMLSLAPRDMPNAWPGTIVSAHFAGGATTLRVALVDDSLVDLDDRGRGHRVGEPVAVAIATASAALVPAT